MIGMKKEEHFIFKQSFYDEFYDGNNSDSKYINVGKNLLISYFRRKFVNM